MKTDFTLSLQKTVAVVSSSMPTSAKEDLRPLVRDIIVLHPDPQLPSPVSSHPDMLLFSLGDTLITYRSYYAIAQAAMDKLLAYTGLHLVLTDHPHGAVYPGDVGLNALPLSPPTKTGGYLFARPASLAPEVTAWASAFDYRILPVKQGYAGCSGLAVGGTLVTADPSLHRAAVAVGIPVVSVAQEGILLPGYDHGFIGGAGGVFGGAVLFCGTPDGAVLDALERHTAVEEVHCLGDTPLFDCGGIRLFPVLSF